MKPADFRLVLSGPHAIVRLASPAGVGLDGRDGRAVFCTGQLRQNLVGYPRVGGGADHRHRRCYQRDREERGQNDNAEPPALKETISGGGPRT
jgi:hypothetical protein